MTPHGTPIWYELHTPDHAAAKRFYDAVVGWTVAGAPDGPVDYRMITAPDGNVGGVIQLNDAMTAGGARPGWLFYLAAEDVDATADRITAAGGAVLMPPFNMAGVGRMAFVADPTGAPFYIMRGEGDGDSTAFAPGVLGHASWHELFTGDGAGALSFYQTIFGWDSPGGMPMGPGRDYRFLHVGDRVLVGLGPSSEPDQPPRWRFYFEVADLDAAMAQVTDGGGQVTFGPQEVPGGGRMVHGVDPAGAFFALVSSPKGH